MENTHTDSHELSTGFYVASFLILLLILAVFGDLFVFILGTIGAIVAYAAYFTSKSAAEDHH
ncbi:hypothetical protein [Salmonirosea aquatica]|uniref:Uncharacterized protein n=1 Tax=Salmonirosea aquatica TaxID=2654236 RepID=A0A7C9FAQ1_9BACT|nr:hypothetical protein [Cytophagaceae bacterium SJW1-29]